MPRIHRNVYFALGAIVILVILYSGPSSLPSTSSFNSDVPAFWRGTEKSDKQQPPPLPPSPPAPVADPPAAIPDPDPLTDAGALKDAEPAKPVDSAPAPTETAKDEDDHLREWFFQIDLKFANPAFDTSKLKHYPPHNYKGPGQDVFATYLSTRNCTLHDPYFQAAQQLAYRVLWDPRSKSTKHPLVVFVAPFIPDENRQLLTAAGALVRELDLVEGHPTPAGFNRWKDLFSKLNMWNQTDFERIAFLDLDAFPFQNIDGIFDISQKQRCRRELLPAEDKKHENEICDYTFSATSVGTSPEVNVGVVVFNPNQAMHEHLMRESTDLTKFDTSMAEQAFLNYAYRKDGPFPLSLVDREWNGFFPNKGDFPDGPPGKLKIVHEKLWSIPDDPNDPLYFAKDLFSETWADMLKLYESKEFEKMRELDGARSY
ncbi:Hypothetical predicted protein [Lecanosticta acicola]|uniref:Nucleotide-diphospho-sugar transferase n=1 Tax=Lecanosticta acicola TaxID=111012 RepID=A0AAI8W0I3_9PEZI|nr:Hypothetical predicted protein [Lecanosticta acicola]